MGLIQDMGKKGGRMGAKLPVPTTAGDDQVIAAKTGEYVLPPEVVAAIGVDKLNAMVASITGQQPGGEPAEMPDGMDSPMHEMMEGEMQGHAKGGCVKGMKQDMQGYARGGLISQIEKGLSSAMTVGASLMPDRYAKPVAPPDLSSVTPDVFRVAAPPSDNLPDGIAPMDERRPLMGYAEGGIVEDDYVRRKLSNYNPQRTIRQPAPPAPAADPNVLRNYNPQATIPPNATTNASPRAPELRNFTPEPGRVQPGATTPRISGLAQQAQAPRPSVSRTVQELDMRSNGQTPRSGPAPSIGERVAGAKQGYAQSQGARASAPKPGLVARAKAIPGMIARTTAATAPLAGFGDYRIDDPGVDSSAGGVISNLATGEGGKAWQGLKQGAVEAGLDSVSGLAKTADSLAGLVGAQPGLAQAFDERVQADIGPMLKREASQVASVVPQANAAEPQGQSFEQKIGRFIANERGTPAPAATASAAPRPTGPVSGLAARAKAQAPAATPQADTSGLQAQIDASPIASVQSGPVGQDGANGHLVTYKDGRQAFAQQLPEDAKAWYALTARANSASPVEVIKGTERFVASPESGYQAVPRFVADAGLTGQYVNAAGQGWVDAVDPTGAAMRLDGAKTDNAIRQSNATDRDGEGRGLRNAAARMELDLTKRALAGDPQAIQQLNLLRGKGGAQDEYAATTREVPVDPANPMLGTVKEPVIFNKRTGLPVQGGTVQSSSAAPQSAVAALRKDPKLAAQFDAKYGQGASAQYLNAR